MKKKSLKDNRFLIITGLSGSGKTAVSRFLEDLGYYCIDNLPAKLVQELINLWVKKRVEIDRMALVMDIREPRFSEDFPGIFNEIRKRLPVKMIFLDASDAVLVKRFSETRRLHPLAHKKSTLQAIKLERLRLEKIKAMADEVIDTSSLNVAELKEFVTTNILRKKKPHFQIVIVSFGYKYGLPLESDLVFDSRFLPNPFYLDNLRDLTGKSLRVKRYVLGSTEAKDFIKEMLRFLDFLLPRFIKEGKVTLTISVGCTGGKHRSVVIADEVYKYLRKPGVEVKIIHRDLYK